MWVEWLRGRKSSSSVSFACFFSNFLLIILIGSCSPYRYISIETCNPASITFPADMRRILVVNNALPQDDVPFESTIHQLPASVTISADSAAFDFCRTLGETLADFPGFDDVRLLEGCLRKDMSPLSAPNLEPHDVELLNDEHETDIVISLDRLLFRINEYAYNIFSFQMQEVIDVDISGVLRVYAPGREAPVTSVLLADTVSVADHKVGDIWELLLSTGQTNLLRVSATYLAREARTHFIPYWSEDIRWYYVSFAARWKEATAYAESEKWDKALDIWKQLYERATSWKQKARLSSNLALGAELTGNLEQALQYAKLSHQLMHDHLGADDAITKKQEVYVNVLTSRIAEEQKLRLQHN